MDHYVTKIEKVKNGWVAFNDNGNIVGVATTDEQLAEMVGIHLPAPTFQGRTELGINFDNMKRMLDYTRSANKIGAIKELRSMFYDRKDHGQTVTFSLREAKDFVEFLQEYT